MFPIRDTKTLGSFPIVNLLLIATNLYVFFLELTAPDLELFINTYALIPKNIDFARVETLIPFIFACRTPRTISPRMTARKRIHTFEG